MRIDFTRELRMLDGSPLRWAQGRDEAATLGMVCIEALLAITSEDQRTLSPARSVERYLLAQQMHANGAAIDLASEQIVELKRLIAQHFPPAISGQACLMLEDTA